MKSFVKAFKNYAKFSGRTTRKDFWMFILFYFLLGVIFIFIDVVFDLKNNSYGHSGGFGYTFTLYQIVTFLPFLSISVRRLHDIGKSGFFIFVCLIPFGGLFVWYWCAKPSMPEKNQYDSSEIDAYARDPYAKQVEALKVSKQVKHEDQCFVMEQQISLDDMAKEGFSTEPATRHRKENHKKYSNIPLIVCAALLVSSLAGNAYLYSQNDILSRKVHETEINYNAKNDKARELLEYKYDTQAEYNFYHQHAVIVPAGSNTYHEYSCELCDTAEFYIYNTENARAQGFVQCGYCRPGESSVR